MRKAAWISDVLDVCFSFFFVCLLCFGNKYTRTLKYYIFVKSYVGAFIEWSVLLVNWFILTFEQISYHFVSFNHRKKRRQGAGYWKRKMYRQIICSYNLSSFLSIIWSVQPRLGERHSRGYLRPFQEIPHFTSTGTIPVFRVSLFVCFCFALYLLHGIDSRSFGSQDIKGTDESTLGKDFSVPLMHCDPSGLGSMICFRIPPPPPSQRKKRTL